MFRTITAAFGAAALLVAASAQARVAPQSPRAVAKAFAQKRLRHQYPGAKVSVARRPLLDDGAPNSVQAYGINIKKPGKHWQQLRQAVVLQRIPSGPVAQPCAGAPAPWKPTGVADVHYINTPNSSRKVRVNSSWLNGKAIYRTPAGNRLFGSRNLSEFARGVARGTRSVAFTPVYQADGGGPGVPGTVQPMVVNGPPSTARTRATVTAPSGHTATVLKDFHRAVILNGGL